MLLCLALAIGVTPLVEGTAATIKGLNRHAAAQSTGRLLGVTSTLTLMVTALAVLWYAFVLVRHAGFRISEWAVLVAAGSVWMSAAWSVDFGKSIGGEYALVLIQDLVHRETLGTGYWQVLNAIDAIGAAAPCVIGAALCGLVLRSEALTPQALAARTRHFRILLYLAIALLIAGTFYVFSLNRWSALVGDEGRREMVLLLSSGIMLNFGLFYSTLLVMAFVPTALLLMHAIDVQERRALQLDARLDVSAWRRAHRLEFSPLTEMRTYWALLSPLVASLVQAYLLGPMLRVSP